MTVPTPPAAAPCVRRPAAARRERQVGTVADGVDWAAQDWDDLVPRLLLFAAGRLRRLIWRGDRRGVPPGAPLPEDLVHEAIAKTIAGQRVWDRTAASLFQHLAGVIASDLNHLAMRAENREVRLTATTDDGAGDRGADPPDGAPGPEAMSARHSEERALLAFLAARDPLLEHMARLMLHDDLHGTEELACRLDVPAGEVPNMRKRLRRAAEAFRQALGDGG